MASDLKQFEPSELKLERLRREGVVSTSLDLITFAAIVGLFIGFSICIAQEGTAFRSLASSSFSEVDLVKDDFRGLKNLFTEGSMLIFRCLAWILGTVLVGVLLTGLIQTRFLITAAQIRLDFSRLFLSGGGLVSGFFRRLVGGSLVALKLLAWIVVALLIVYYIYSDELPSTKLDGLSLSFAQVEGVNKVISSELEHGRVVLHRAWLTALAFSFFVGIGSYFIGLIMFRRRHRMTRAEVEAEYREMETSPEFRSARRDFSSEQDE